MALDVNRRICNKAKTINLMHNCSEGKPSKSSEDRVAKLTRCLVVSTILAILTPLSLDAQITRKEIEELREQVRQLKETQNSLHQAVQEIRALLQGSGVAPNVPPANLTVSVDDDPFKGENHAKLILIEFSDYQCPFCGRFFQETLPAIEKEYVNTGKLKYVYRDFPIESIHPDAFKAHEAANCAGEQGKYWEMHDRLFQNQNQLGAAELPKHGEAIGLKAAEFEQCLKSGKQGTEIRRDMEDGQKAGVQGTPTFFLGLQEPDGKTIKVLRMIVGAQPYGQFKEAIDRALGEVEKLVGSGGVR